MKPLMKAASLFVAASLPLVGGCAALVGAAVGVGAGAGTYAYVKGKSTATERADMDKTYAAAEKTVKEMDLAVKESTKDDTSAKIVAEKADGQQVTITLDRKGPEVTEVGVRVGVFGEERTSRLIIDKISHNLGDRQTAMAE